MMLVVVEVVVEVLLAALLLRFNLMMVEVPLVVILT
jgi:hypothetical protein